MHGARLAASVPLLLLVTAGLNHAHGLTTFGKSGTTPPSHPPPPTMRKCYNQTECYAIKGTTCMECKEIKGSGCVNNYCFCGDNRHPINGKCSNEYKGPNHVCSSTDECVIGAECSRNSTNKLAPGEKTCQCLEGYLEIGAHCSGEGFIDILPGLIAIVATLTRVLQ